MAEPEPNFEAIKQKQNAAWTAGNYSVLGTMLQPVGEYLAESLDLHAGDKVLDVAAGNGNFSLAAARCWTDVISTDYVPDLLERGKQRAAADGLTIRFEVADAENLPYADDSFDVVGSTFGVMFAPNHTKSAAEMVRVCKSGGKIGMANWTADGFLGQFFKTMTKYAPPPAGVKPPILWGTEPYLHEFLDAHAADISISKKAYTFRYSSPAHWLEVFRTNFGPLQKAYESIDADGQTALSTDILAVIDGFNQVTDGAMIVPADYLEVVITTN